MVAGLMTMAQRMSLRAGIQVETMAKNSRYHVVSAGGASLLSLHEQQLRFQHKHLCYEMPLAIRAEQGQVAANKCANYGENKRHGRAFSSTLEHL